jgi:hypothetical protein
MGHGRKPPPPFRPGKAHTNCPEMLLLLLLFWPIMLPWLLWRARHVR